MRKLQVAAIGLRLDQLHIAWSADVKFNRTAVPAVAAFAAEIDGLALPAGDHAQVLESPLRTLLGGGADPLANDVCDVGLFFSSNAYAARIGMNLYETRGRHGACGFLHPATTVTVNLRCAVRLGHANYSERQHYKRKRKFVANHCQIKVPLFLCAFFQSYGAW